MLENEKEQNAQEISKVHVMEAAKFKKPMLNRPNKPSGFKKPNGLGKSKTKTRIKGSRKSLVGYAGKMATSSPNVIIGRGSKEKIMLPLALPKVQVTTMMISLL
ncbi:hypothetical protein Sjap_008791 [Stephania japonica]|uniref:Uncharacterized protein n=1 Tax=Stephania japonica TaxID=461633 RepID=A0AAP0JSL5_9MAGN